MRATRLEPQGRITTRRGLDENVPGVQTAPETGTKNAVYCIHQPPGLIGGAACGQHYCCACIAHAAAGMGAQIRGGVLRGIA